MEKVDTVIKQGEIDRVLTCIGDVVYAYEIVTNPLEHRLHHLPQNQCPSCLDIGQYTYNVKGKWILVCPYCKCQYTIKLDRKESNKC